ncbi:phage major capsid protein [Streptomyces sp. NBRC 109706]|uniref:phage major capsid protein n=1 Tax=Streptomyces sp. NBRC 109706 TaxID=1550035 RepID=UPI0007817815|nr:phage major capsid protein [Streptomyces sp. NBRC 109706]
MNLREQRDAALKAAQEPIEAAKTAGRAMTKDEIAESEKHLARVDELDEQIGQAEKAAALAAKAFAVPAGQPNPGGTGEAVGVAAKLAADEAYKSATLAAKSRTRFSQRSVEFGAKDFSTGGAAGGLVQTQYGQVVPEVLRRPTIATLLGSGTLSATTLTYYVQGPTTGGFAPVAELGEKPAIDFGFEPQIETLTKIAGITKISDESFQDVPYLVSVIEGQMRLRLVLAEEDQLLNGDGTGINMTGILNRDGILTEASAGPDDDLDALFRAMTNIDLATQLPADAVVINPLDYQRLRLSRDANEQYFAGGPFTGAYGNGGFGLNPGLWQQRTVITSAIAEGTALVGAFEIGGQVLRKGGVSVEMTNSDQDDFIHNRVTLRAEERLLLAVYQPAAFCEVTLAGSGS